MAKRSEIVELLKEKGQFETKKEAVEFLDKVDEVVKVIGQELRIDDKAKLGSYIAIEKKHVESKSGELKGVAYTTEAKDVIKIKATGLAKKEL